MKSYSPGCADMNIMTIEERGKLSYNQSKASKER